MSNIQYIKYVINNIYIFIYQTVYTKDSHKKQAALMCHFNGVNKGVHLTPVLERTVS